MTTRTTDFHCQKCGKYMFSKYMGADTTEKAWKQLDKKATDQCACKRRHYKTEEVSHASVL